MAKRLAQETYVPTALLIPFQHADKSKTKPWLDTNQPQQHLCQEGKLTIVIAAEIFVDASVLNGAKWI